MTTPPARRAMGANFREVSPPALKNARSTFAKDSEFNSSAGMDSPRKFTDLPIERAEASARTLATGNPRPTYSLVSAPSGMTINTTNGWVLWTPTTNQVGNTSVTVRATSAAGVAEQVFALTVTPKVTTKNSIEATISMATAQPSTVSASLCSM